jgi:glycosyltransferase involved in cell wall biosynthesis
MHLALLADTFPPLRSSGAVQLRDLSCQIARDGHDLTVMIPSSEIQGAHVLEEIDGYRVLRLKAPRTKDVPFVKRVIGESLMSFAMRASLAKSPLEKARYDGIIWYSPTIFLGSLVSHLKRQSDCRSYLILRDIFPEWTVDMGLMGRGLPYLYFKAVEAHQYAQADVIGVQSPSNFDYFKKWSAQPGRQVEVLENWLEHAPDRGCSLRIFETRLKGKKIFVYAGNMGVAQGMDRLMNLAAAFRHRDDVGFLFVGRGTETDRLRKEAEAANLLNTVFHDEMPAEEIPGLLAQCHFGLVALDPRHRTHNLPGKFLTYMSAGLPVLAAINTGNDLARLIEDEEVGRASVDPTGADLPQLANEILAEADQPGATAQRCKDLFARLYSPEVAARQIVRGLQQ